MTAIEGTGCARPRLLSLGVGKPLLMSGGRMCVENMTGTELTLPQPLSPTATSAAAGAALRVVQRGDVLCCAGWLPLSHCRAVCLGESKRQAKPNLASLQHFLPP